MLKTGNLVEVKGDAFVGRIFDNDDDFRRLDFTMGDLSSDAPWIKQVRRWPRRRSRQDGVGGWDWTSPPAPAFSPQAQQHWKKKREGESLEDAFARITGEKQASVPPPPPPSRPRVSAPSIHRPQIRLLRITLLPTAEWRC